MSLQSSRRPVYFPICIYKSLSSQVTHHCHCRRTVFFCTTDHESRFHSDFQRADVSLLNYDRFTVYFYCSDVLKAASLSFLQFMIVTVISVVKTKPWPVASSRTLHVV